MRNEARALLAVLVFAMVVAGGAAFASGDSEVAAAGSDGEPSGRLWVMYRQPQWADIWIEPQLNAFNGLYPEVEVELQHIPHAEYTFRLQLAFASGNVPDAIELNINQNFDFFATQGLLESLQPYVDRDGFPTDAFSKEVIDRLSRNGELFMMPMGSHSGISGVVYNKTHFDAAGLDYPSEDWTYDDLLELARDLTITDESGRTVQFGVAAPAVWVPIVSVLASFGGGWIDESGTRSRLLDEETREAYMYLDRLLNQERVSPRGDELPGHPILSFMGGQSSMYFTGVWELGTIRRGMGEGMEFGVAPLPIGPAGRVAGGANIDAFAMTSQSTNKEAAWAMLEWLGGEEMQARVVTEGLGTTPRTHLLQELGVFDDPMMKPFIDVFVSGSYEPSPIPANFRAGEMRNAIGQSIDPALIGTMTMEEALQAAHTALQAVLDLPTPEEM